MASMEAVAVESTLAPLLSPSEKMGMAPVKGDGTKSNDVAPSSGSSSSQQEQLQFHDPSSVLDVSRDVAFGFLILLTGGTAEYEPPTTLEDAQSSRSLPLRSSTPVDDESTSLAYAAIVDGNVLHACFGLKATRTTTTTAMATGVGNNNAVVIGGKKKRSASSMLCCFPSSSSSAAATTLDALQLVLPHSAANELKMQNLVEILREVGDMRYYDEEAAAAAGGGGEASDGGADTISTATTEGAGSANNASKVPLHVQVIRAYVDCFAAIVRYYDLKRLYVDDVDARNKRRKGDNGGNNSESNNKTDDNGGIIVCCSRLVRRVTNRVLFFSRRRRSKSSDPRLELLRRDAQRDIEDGFGELREKIWEGLERASTETAFTGVSVEE